MWFGFWVFFGRGLEFCLVGWFWVYFVLGFVLGFLGVFFEKSNSFFA